MIFYYSLLAFFLFWTGSIIVERILKKRNGQINDNKQSNSKRTHSGKKLVL